jgi:hypothetical protein
VFLKSTNGGESWSKHTVSGTPFGYTPALAFSPFDDNTMYVGLGKSQKGERNDYILQTTDGGENWTLINQFSDTQINDMAVDPNSPQKIFMASNKGILQSKDSGLSWEVVFDTMATTLAVSPSDSREIYAGCYDGVFASFDGGQSWTKLSSESDYPYVHCLEFNRPTQILFAGLHERGILTYRESDKLIAAIIAGTGGTTIPQPGIYLYPAEAEISIKAIPDTHYLFKNWSGSISGEKNPLEVMMDADMTIKANFHVQLFPPSDFRGEKVVNRSLALIEHINLLRWRKNPDNSHIIKYLLFRIESEANVLIAELDSETFEYWDRQVDKDQEYEYALVAVHTTGEKSAPVYTTVR